MIRAIRGSAIPIRLPSTSLFRDVEPDARARSGRSGNGPILRATLGMILPAQTEIVLFWEADFVAFYNDAYALTIKPAAC
jgi:hypothetical protein